ncbi:N-acetylglucosamine-6-phosphate deacetylase [Granulicella arctica]|uniref:N-acetylglucosamine-6-phosphate deacetylase n=1 Tax=Granulicella arctica TaxID=940613 RepID=UPI0021DF50DC|nr:N-acetylglucosamine-6-phosphate deacetylase [Granulicella arctica]
MPQTITAARLHTQAQTWINPVITLDDDGRIQSVESAAASTDDTILTPTFFDIHIHGAVNHDVMEGTPEAFARIGSFLAARGVGHYLATTVTAGIDATLRALEGIATQVELPSHEGATPLGIHLEGPFVSHAKRGVHPPEHIVPPTIELFDRFQQAARGTIRLITLAPEIPGALDLIRHATAKGVKVSLGHSNATAAETHAAIAAGATSATHTFNAMRPLDHREPGILGVVLDDPTLFAELICDGIHVAPELVRLFYKAKGASRAILVTDGMSATGMPDGTYMLGGFEVEVADGRCMANGVLAGSVLTMDRAVANFASFTGAAFAEVTDLASTNPARMLGLEAQMAIAPGQPANFNRYNPDGTLHATILNGRRVV